MELDGVLDFDTLIPEELKTAVGELEGKKPEEDDDDDVAPAPAPAPAPASAPSKAGKPETQQQPKPTENAPKVVVKDTPDDDSDDDVEMSDDLLKKLAEGELDALLETPKGKDAAPEDEPPFWADDELYKNITRTLTNYGIEPRGIDDLLKKVVDKHTVDNSKLMQNLRKEYDTVAKEKKTQESELSRLKGIERAVRFDNLPSTLEKYIDPMAESEKIVREVISREGIKLSINDVFNAKNKAELANMLSDFKLEDKDYTKIVNQWRTYKDLETGYFSAKDEAVKNLNKALVTHISDETIDTYFRNNLSDAISKEEYAVVAEAIKGGIENSPEIADVISKSRANFASIMQAINRSSEASTDPRFINSVSNLMLRAAFNEHRLKDYMSLQEKHALALKSLSKLSSNYKKLARSAQGIQGKKGQVFVKNGKDTDADDTEQKAETLKKFYSGDISFEDL